MALRGAFHWARRRCDAALDEAHTYPPTGGRPTMYVARAEGRGLSRAEARTLAAFQQALDAEGRGVRLFLQPAVPVSGEGDPY
ncbi:MAG: hypothetical protein ACRDKW_03425 [Actinomycetota bacterium]